MFEANGRKMKLLELRRLLEEETDAEHGLNATQISERLKAKGISAGIKAIYDDIHALNYFYQPADKRKAARAPHIELDENGAMHCQLTNVEVMGRDVSVVSTHGASLNANIRSIVDADNKIDLGAKTVNFSVKPHKLFLFHKETEERIYFTAK